MPVFIHKIQGRILSIDYGKKEFSLCIEEASGGQAVEKTAVFSLDPHARITNVSNQPMKLVALKEGRRVEIGYARDRAKITALHIAVLD